MPDETALTLHYAPEQVTLIRQAIAPQISDTDFAVFMTIAARTGLDPLSKQIYAIPRKTRVKRGSQWVDEVQMTIQTGIDGYRTIAQRSGQMSGSSAPEWCGKDGIWRDVWLDDEPPAAAKMTVYRNGEPFTHIATYKEYVQKVPVYEGSGDNRKQVGTKPNSMWESMPANQLAKCAEAGALRKAFPVELGGVFVDAEEAGIQYVVEVEQQRQESERPAIQQPQRRSQQQAKPKAQGNIPPGRTRDPGPPFGSEDDDAVDAEFHVEGPAQQGPADQPAATGEVPWGTFWNEWQGKHPLVPLSEVKDALELPKADLASFRAWYEGNGSSLELIDLVADKVAAMKGEG